MRVTTEKPSRLHGSTADGEPTNCRAKDARGRFDTEEAAQAVIARVKEVTEQHRVTIRHLSAARNGAEDAERLAIEAVVNGHFPDPPKSAAEWVKETRDPGRLAIV